MEAQWCISKRAAGNNQQLYSHTVCKFLDLYVSNVKYGQCTHTRIRTYVSFKHGRLLHTYTRFFTWTRVFFAKKRTTGYVRTMGTGTGVKRSVFYELHRTYVRTYVYVRMYTSTFR